MREYDPVIGRWTAVDPKRIGFSPYIGMANNPLKFFDPDGGGPEDDWKLLNDGTFELSARTEDDFHRFYNEDGQLIYQTNWSEEDFGGAIASFGGVNPANDWLENFRSLNRAFGFEKNDLFVSDMFERAQNLNWDYSSLNTLSMGAERAKNADLIDFTLSFFDIRPTKGYSPGVRPLRQGIKYFTGMPADKYPLFWKTVYRLHHAKPWDPNDPKMQSRPVNWR